MANNEKLKNVLQNKADGNSSVAPTQEKGMAGLLQQMSVQIERALPKMVSSERFQRVVLTAFNANSKLQKCEPMSFIAAMMQSAQLGLEPNTPLGQAYLIPYGNKVQFQIGYKGLLELAQRSSKIKAIYAHTVYENDQFDIDYGVEQMLSHKPLLKGERGEAIGYYAVYHLANGGYSFAFMTKDEILNFARSKSKTFNSGPWQTDFDEMAKKTVLKKLLKYAPISIEGLSEDNSVKTEISEDMKLVKNDSDYSDVIEVSYEEDVNDNEVEPLTLFDKEE